MWASAASVVSAVEVGEGVGPGPGDGGAGDTRYRANMPVEAIAGVTEERFVVASSPTRVFSSPPTKVVSPVLDPLVPE